MESLRLFVVRACAPLLTGVVVSCGGSADTQGGGGPFGAAGTPFTLAGSGGAGGAVTAPASVANGGTPANADAAPAGGPQSAGGAFGAGGFPATGGSGAFGAGGSGVGVGGGVGAGGASGAAGMGAAGGAAVPWSSISALIPMTCGGTTCHTSRQKPYFLNDSTLHDTLINTVVSECGGAHLVVPGNPQGSAIIQLVNRTCSKNGRVFFMPRNCTTNPCLPASQIQTITGWIAEGAPGM
jgi:hypothetical protein